MEAREQRGLQLARAAKKLSGKRSESWVVPSQTGKGRYSVHLGGDSPRCTCPDHEFRGQKCKHIFAVEYAMKRETAPDGTTTVTETVRVTYGQNWSAYNAAKSEEKTKFVALLADLCRLVPEQAKGRPRFPFSDMVFAAAFKVYVGFSSRRFTSDLRDAHAGGYIASTPHFNSVSNYLANPGLTGILKELISVSSLPLKALETDFAVDSSGFSSSRFDRWFDHKYGREQRKRDWFKAHLMCGVRTKIVTGVDVSGRNGNDSYFFAPLVEATAQNFRVSEVSADKAYLGRENMKTVERAGGTPFIPFKSNTVEPANDSSAWAKMYHFFMFNRETFLEHYHKRSNVESAFSMIKGKFGDSVRSKSDVGQVNEVFKVLCHNVCVLVQAIHELGIEPIFSC